VSQQSLSTVAAIEFRAERDRARAKPDFRPPAFSHEMLASERPEAPAANSSDDYGVAGSSRLVDAGEDTDAAPMPPLTIVNAASFADVEPPRREWHVAELIPAREITMLAGDGGTGKSLLALQLAVATATGTEWVGSFPSIGRVLFVSAEDDIDELHRRVATIARMQGVQIAELDRLEFLPLAGKDAVIAAPLGRDGLLSPTRLFEAIRAAIEAKPPDLLILDPLADLFGGDEIKRPHARQFIGLLRGWAIDFKLTVLLLTHPSLSGMSSGAGTSGSTAWSNSVRSRLYLTRPPGGGDDDGDTRVLETMKANYGRVGDKRVLRWHDGVFKLDSAARPDKLEADAEDDRVFLAILADFARSGRAASENKSSTFAPARFAEHPSAKGLSAARLNAAMQRLFAASRIHNETSGPPSTRRRRIVAGPPPATASETEAAQ
jgi:RecA-family ATPase